MQSTMPSTIKNQIGTRSVLLSLMSHSWIFIVAAIAVIAFLLASGSGRTVSANPAADPAPAVTNVSSDSAIALEDCCDVFVRQSKLVSAILYDFGRSVNDEAEWVLYAPKTGTATGQLYDFGRSVNDEAEWALYAPKTGIATGQPYDFGRSVNDEAEWALYAPKTGIGTSQLYDFGRSVNDEAEWALYAPKTGTDTGRLYNFGRSVNNDLDWGVIS